jgi:hypothetical protein
VIKKYLIIGKHITLSSTRFEVAREDDAPGPIEVRAPVDVIWKAQEILKEAEIQLSSGEGSQAIKDTYSRLLKLLAPHCTAEKDRLWVYQQIQ